MDPLTLLAMVTRGIFVVYEVLENHQTEVTEDQLEFIRGAKKLERDAWKALFPDLAK